MSAAIQREVQPSNDLHEVSLAAETDDEEEYLTPMNGTVLAFSLAMNNIVDCYEDPIVKAALRQFQPRKYLGIVRGGHESFEMNGYTVHLFHLATRSVGEGYPGLDEGHDKADWYDGVHVAMGTRCAVPDNGRPMLSCSPPLPWSDCIVYTSLGSVTAMGTLHTVEGDPCRLSREGFNRLMDYFKADYKALSERRDRAREAYKSAKAERAEIITPASAAELAKTRLPVVPLIVDLWEDFSDVTEVLYPGHFEAECVELQRLVKAATEEALKAPQTESLRDGESLSAVVDVSKPESDEGKSEIGEMPPSDALLVQDELPRPDDAVGPKSPSIPESNKPTQPPPKWWQRSLKPRHTYKALVRVALSTPLAISGIVRTCRSGVTRVCDLVLCRAK